MFTKKSLQTQYRILDYNNEEIYGYTVKGPNFDTLIACKTIPSGHPLSAVPLPPAAAAGAEPATL